MARLIRVVAGMIVRDGEVLLARRGPAMDLAGHWEFPGGKLEAGEGPEAALVRELEEELDIHVRPLRELARSRVPRGDAVLQLEGWLAELVRGEPIAREHDALAWTLPIDIDRTTLAPADLPLLDALQALESSK